MVNINIDNKSLKKSLVLVELMKKFNPGLWKSFPVQKKTKHELNGIDVVGIIIGTVVVIMVESPPDLIHSEQ
jgi:hypothetical protein